jgi:hypothetical protein
MSQVTETELSVAVETAAIELVLSIVGSCDIYDEVVPGGNLDYTLIG